MLPAGHWPATSWVHYTTNCNTQSSAPEDVQNNCPKHVELTGIFNNPLLLHLVGCLYYLHQWCTVKQISDNEIYLLFKYIKSVLWRVAKRLSYIEDARCLQVKLRLQLKNSKKLLSLLPCIILLYLYPSNHPELYKRCSYKLFLLQWPIISSSNILTSSLKSRYLFIFYLFIFCFY